MNVKMDKAPALSDGDVFLSISLRWRYRQIKLLVNSDIPNDDFEPQFRV